MWIAVAVLAAAAVGVVAWWLRRDPADDGFEVEGDLGLGAEARPAFAEGLRACHDRGDGPRIERGVLTMYDPPCLVSLYLLADGFATRGDAALHDPEGTVATLMNRLATAERPGILHLRRDWLTGEVDGMDRGGFAGAVRESVCPGGDWAGDEVLGSSYVTVSGEQPNTMMLDLARVLDRYLEAREKQPDAPARALLREVVTRMATADGPGLTWVRPPTPEEREGALAAGPS
ncbi:hypothetical protein ITP53_21105 [Nonomuraea sp. K274]|uniref:Uncharacterized protein n=1 Tax=Nonomuraea cypriaca TaxID=1187855 RepID=A0A931F027_9ACTN|nr:hypothetical protein [Nonomuraea cypriaca]MBF8188182.1 hypothetical protein [Nonomuraea cypriaca]